jgi:hypothetical protein
MWHRSLAQPAWMLVMALALSPAPTARAQSVGRSIPLVVEEGTPLRVALDRRLIVKRVGQPVDAIVVDPVFVYDRTVIPAGTRVRGHVHRRDAVPRKQRMASMLSGDFTPLHDIELQFDTLVLADGRRLPVSTQASPGTERITLAVAEGTERGGHVVARAGEEAAQQAKETVAVFTRAGRWERMKDAGLRALPYHPEFVSKGTVFNARLLSPLDVGLTATARELADPGTVPGSGSVLSARLLSTIDSGHAATGTPVAAMVTRPVFSATQQLLLPAGTRLTGHVTFVKRAGRFRRNGQLRFLLDTVHVEGHDAATLLASLHAVESGRDERVAIDDEGGAKVTNPPARFVAPALGTLALVGLSRSHLDYDTDGAGAEVDYGGPVSGSVAGLVGASVTGVLISSIGHPAAVALGVLGVARTTYSSVFAKGREITFRADTPIQVQLAPERRKTTP